MYVGADVHERETQLAVYDAAGSLLLERRLSTKELTGFVSSFPGEKHVAMESVGFFYALNGIAIRLDMKS